LTGPWPQQHPLLIIMEQKHVSVAMQAPTTGQEERKTKKTKKMQK